MTTETRHRFTAPRRERLDRLVAEALPALSRSQAQRLIEQGQVQDRKSTRLNSSH